MNLFDIIACPTCKCGLSRSGDLLTCEQCQQRYPIINNVPVLFPDGSVPAIQHESELSIRTTYNPWVERLVMQSLPASAIVLDLGAGNMAFNLPHVIRMDVTLTPYVDVVGDAHAMPFLPGVFDFVFSLAVIEHLRQPFVAAQETYTVLRDGGYVYGECNFVYPYHGYPHHYFGMTQQGIEQVFKQFQRLRVSVATYQMPSFAMRVTLQEYHALLGNTDDPEIHQFRDLLKNVIEQPLGNYDTVFTEETAMRVAAGVFFFGYKSPNGTSDVIPAIVQDVWRQREDLQRRFPDMFNLGTTENIMLWAKSVGREELPALAQYFDGLSYFRKSDNVGDADLDTFRELSVDEPSFGHIADTAKASSLSQQNRELKDILRQKDEHIANLERLIQRIEMGRVMRLLRLLKR